MFLIPFTLLDSTRFLVSITAVFDCRHSSGFTSPPSLPLSILSIIWTPSPYINLMYSVLRLQFEYHIWLTPSTPRALMALLQLACSHLITSLYLHLWPTPKYRTTEHADKGAPHKVKLSPNHPQLWTSSELHTSSKTGLNSRGVILWFASILFFSDFSFLFLQLLILSTSLAHWLHLSL